MIRNHEAGRFGGSRWRRAWLVLVTGCVFAAAAACAGGEEAPLFDNAAGKKAGSGGQAGSSSGSSGGVNNGGSGGAGQGGAGQGGAGQGGSGQGGAGHGGSAQGGSAGAAMAGSSGAGGSAGSANTDAGVPDVVTTSCAVPAVVGMPVTGQGVTLKYLLQNTNPTDNSIQFRIQIAGSASIPLSELEVRYYFTNEATAPYTLELFYGGLMGTDITVKVKRMLVPLPAVPGADAYLSYTFDATAGTLTSGGMMEFNPGFHRFDFQANFSECDDYSHDSTAADYKENPRIAVYRNGTLIWGAPPGAPTPEGGADGGASDAAAESAASDAAVDSPPDQSVADTAVEAAGD